MVGGLCGLMALTGGPARAGAGESGASCAPPGWNRAELLELRRAGFALADDAKRNALATALLSCVGDRDPEIRDGVVYEGLSKWLREKSLSVDTVDALYAGLLAQLGSAPDRDGFQRPFAALILSEVARTDRVEPGFSDQRREELVAVAQQYLSGVRDYRGFSDLEGWRHGVAHGSDLALQLVLNENVGAEQVRKLLTAVASQVAPAGEVFYIYGEPARLARPVIYAYRRGILDESYWKQWFGGLTDPAPMESWREAYSSNAGLARRHNTLAFLMVMHLNASALPEGEGRILADIVMDALGRVL